MKLHRDLLLFEFVSAALGGDFPSLSAACKDADHGRRADGQSHWFGVLEGRASKLAAGPLTPPLDLAALRRYDLNILSHEARLARRRGGFRLKFFQYLALLYAEVFLDRLTSDAPQWLLDLEAFRKARFAQQTPLAPKDLLKLAFWMATGAGKTLLLHLNVLQFQHYGLFKPANILLLAPNRGLADQHLSDLEQSGVPACHALERCAGYHGIQVLEITKLYVPESGKAGPRSGESLPTDHFEGPNLLLVDEGHKGTANESDAKEERAWRKVREALAGNGGFTIEYSATFAQVAEQDNALHAEYARCILFDYAYRSFYLDGYGKDYWVANLQGEPDNTHEDLLLMGGLLAFYQQRRYFDAEPEARGRYLIEPPLMVFIGDKVSAGKAPEVLAVIRFLDRVCRDKAWALARAARVLRADTGLARPDGADLFADRFPYLTSLNLSPERVVAELRRDLFLADGDADSGLSLHLIKGADGEIGIRARAAAADAYCGVINVGDASNLLKRVAEATEIPTDEDDSISPSLFKGLDSADSTISFLVGSKKFLEGWSSWRVSTMGLLKVGQNAGAQVLQLFGRGIRLKGLQFSMRRSAALDGALARERPAHLPLLETLNIFGLRAKYLATFLNTLQREDLEPPVVMRLPIDLQPGLGGARLHYPKVRDDFRFLDLSIRFDPTAVTAQLNLMPTLGVGDKDGFMTAAQAVRYQSLGGVRRLLPMESLYRHALAHKARKEWGNLFIARADIDAFLMQSANLAAPPEVLAPTTRQDLERLSNAARTLIEQGIDRFYLRRQRAEETQNAQLSLFDDGHANIPRLGESPAPAYELHVPPRLVAEVQAIIADERRRLAEDTAEPLPRLHLDQHLYAPLLLAIEGTRDDGDVVTSVPTGLVGSERRFLEDLRGYWNDAWEDPAWHGIDLFLLRNLPKKGIGFFQTGGFYPDFMLWMQRGDKQALAFVEPHGVVHQEQDKLDLLAFIRGDLAREVSFPIFAFIVTDTELKQVQWLNGTDKHKRDELRKRHVLTMEDTRYIEVMLTEMETALP
jgi:hypothetical protein